MTNVFSWDDFNSQMLPLIQEVELLINLRSEILKENGNREVRENARQKLRGLQKYLRRVPHRFEENVEAHEKIEELQKQLEFLDSSWLNLLKKEIPVLENWDDYVSLVSFIIKEIRLLIDQNEWSKMLIETDNLDQNEVSIKRRFNKYKNQANTWENDIVFNQKSQNEQKELFHLENFTKKIYRIEDRWLTFIHKTYLEDKGFFNDDISDDQSSLIYQEYLNKVKDAKSMYKFIKQLPQHRWRRPNSDPRTTLPPWA